LAAGFFTADVFAFTTFLAVVFLAVFFAVFFTGFFRVFVLQ
jgi:hypothetical protein